MSALEDLIEENRRTFTDELRGARAVPRDEQATSELKGDPDQLAKLAKLAEVEPDKIVDVAVRGANVTFMVADAEGAVSAGYFPTASLSGNATQAKRDSGTVASRTPQDPSPQGGAATVPTVATTNGKEPGPGDEAPVPPPQGVPADFDDLSGPKVAELLKDTPDGIDPHAVLTHEFARDDGPRTAVERAARTLGMLDDAGNIRPL